LKAIILAAGKGTRLHPLTKDKPKSMVKLFGKSLLQWQLDTYRKLGIEDISIVTGYKNNLIKFEDVKLYHNFNFENTNMVETLFCAEKELDDGVIISYGDIIFETDVLQKLIKSPDEFSIIVDKNWEKYWKIRNENPLDDAESLKIDNSGNIISIGQKVSDISEIQGQYIGLMKFQGSSLNIIKKFYHKIKERSKTELNPLNQSLLFEKSYLTDLLYGLIRERNNLKAVIIQNGWLELDTMKDYKIYNDMNINNTLSKIINLDKI
jgi:choline kinase|tara:strand:+ start:5935 stop:6729 length:795 start_codon:yes stop_codon:yes gene_type:complete